MWPRWRAGTKRSPLPGGATAALPAPKAAFAGEIEGHLLRARQEEARPHRVPLGLLLVSRGLISSAQLQEALGGSAERPRRAPGKHSAGDPGAERNRAHRRAGNPVGLSGLPAGHQPRLSRVRRPGALRAAAVARHSARASCPRHGRAPCGLHPAHRLHPVVCHRADVRRPRRPLRGPRPARRAEALGSCRCRRPKNPSSTACGAPRHGPPGRRIRRKAGRGAGRRSPGPPASCGSASKTPAARTICCFTPPRPSLPLRPSRAKDFRSPADSPSEGESGCRV